MDPTFNIAGLKRRSDAKPKAPKRRLRARLAALCEATHAQGRGDLFRLVPVGAIDERAPDGSAYILPAKSLGEHPTRRLHSPSTFRDMPSEYHREA